MKKLLVILSLALALTACTSQLSEVDKAKLDGAYAAAQQSQNEAAAARAEATASRMAAEQAGLQAKAAQQAAEAAQAASTKADRIFREGQNK